MTIHCLQKLYSILTCILIAREHFLKFQVSHISNTKIFQPTRSSVSIDLKLWHEKQIVPTLHFVRFLCASISFQFSVYEKVYANNSPGITINIWTTRTTGQIATMAIWAVTTRIANRTTSVVTIVSILVWAADWTRTTYARIVAAWRAMRTRSVITVWHKSRRTTMVFRAPAGRATGRKLIIVPFFARILLVVLHGADDGYGQT